MDALVALVGVFGTLAGSGLTAWQSERRESRSAQRELARDRQAEEIKALSQLAVSILEYRSYELARLHRVWESGSWANEAAFRDDSGALQVREARRTAWKALLEFRIRAGATDVQLRLESVLDRLTALRRLPSLDEAIGKSVELRAEVGEIIDSFRQG